MAFSLSRTVLIISDEALCIYKVRASGVQLVESVSWRIPEFAQTVALILNRVAGDSGVIILNDAVEQHYRREKLPQISVMDKSSVIKRRLNVAFPNYPTKGALEIKDKSKSAFKLTLTKPAPSADNQGVYLFAAVPASDNYRKTQQALLKAKASVAAFVLLPVESADMVDQLATRVAKENKQTEKSAWTILIGQHHGGGLRQIVVRDGYLALTRISPLALPEDVDPGQWAGDVAQDFQSTITYLSRFGYAPQDGLDVIMVGNPELSNLVGDLISTPCNFTALTLMRAGQLLGLNIGRNVDPHYADALHVAWIAKKRSLSLKMTSPEFNEISNPRKTALAAMFLLTFGFGYTGFSLAQEVIALRGFEDDTKKLNIFSAEVEKMYQDELKRKEEMGIDVNLIRASISIYGSIQKRSYDPIPVLEVISRELRILRLDALDLQVSGEAAAGPSSTDGSAPATLGPRDMTLVLKFSFPGTTRPEDGNEQIIDLATRLRKALPNYQISIPKNLMDLSFRGEIKDETGVTAVERMAENRFTAEIRIQRTFANEGNSGT